jgi:hypothetical protein
MSRMLKSRYRGGWKNVQDGCQLCEMEEKTKWHFETKDFVIAEKPSGGDMIVSKHHEQELSDERRDRAERLVGMLYDDFELQVLMNHVEDHWHAHIIEG